MCCPLQAALKKYQMEHKSKGESLEKCQAELKKLRRKSQGSKHPSKYGDKEMQVSVWGTLFHWSWTQGPASWAVEEKVFISTKAQPLRELSRL